MPILWSPTRLDYMNYCLMRYWLRYVEKESPLRLSAYVKGGLFHDSIEKFWEKLGTPEQVAKKSSKKKYYDAESFTKYTRGRWKALVIGSKNAKFPIYWSYEQEPWAIDSVFARVCPALFDMLHEEGPPTSEVISLREVPFEMQLLGHRFRGRIDRIKNENGIVKIIDYKSGRPWMKDMKLDFDPQLTLYNAAVCAMAAQDERFAKILGLENKRHMYMGNPLYLDPDFEMQFFMIEALGSEKEIPVIHSSRRVDQHFFEVVDMIEKGKERIRQGLVYAERGRKCDDCDLRIQCKKKLESVGREDDIGKTGQFEIQLASPLILKKTKEEEKLEEKLAAQQQLRLPLRRDLANYQKNIITND